MPIDFRGEPTKYAPESNRPSAPTVGVGVLYIASDTENVFRSDGATWTEVGALPLGEVFNARSYGAKGDGVTDDTLAIQAAINAASVHGGIVFIPTGAYKLTSTLTVSAPGHSVTIQGASRGAAPGEFGGGILTGTQLIGTNGIDGIHLSAVGYPVVRDLEISIANGATLACNGINITQCYMPLLENVRIANYSTGVHLSGSTDTYFNRVYCGSNGVTVTTCIGFNIDGTSHVQNQSVYIRDCLSAHLTFSGTAYAYYLHGNRINDVTFDTCEADFTTYGFAIDGSAGLDAGYSGDIRLVNCVIDAVTTGVYVHSCPGDTAITIANGWIASTADCVLIDGSSGVTVDGMQLWGGTNGVSMTGGSGLAVIGNRMMYIQQNGVLIVGAVNCFKVADNHFEAKIGNTMSGACVNVPTGVNDFAVIGNVAHGNAAAQFANGIVVDVGSDPFTAVGNVMPAGFVTTPYNLNLGSNVNSKDVANI